MMNAVGACDDDHGTTTGMDLTDRLESLTESYDYISNDLYYFLETFLITLEEKSRNENKLTGTSFNSSPQSCSIHGLVPSFCGGEGGSFSKIVLRSFNRESLVSPKFFNSAVEALSTNLGELLAEKNVSFVTEGLDAVAAPKDLPTEGADEGEVMNPKSRFIICVAPYSDRGNVDDVLCDLRREHDQSNDIYLLCGVQLPVGGSIAMSSYLVERQFWIRPTLDLNTAGPTTSPAETSSSHVSMPAFGTTLPLRVPESVLGCQPTRTLRTSIVQLVTILAPSGGQHFSNIWKSAVLGATDRWLTSTMKMLSSASSNHENEEEEKEQLATLLSKQHLLEAMLLPHQAQWSCTKRGSERETQYSFGPREWDSKSSNYLRARASKFSAEENGDEEKEPSYSCQDLLESPLAFSFCF